MAMAALSLSTVTTLIAIVMRVAWRCVELDFYIDRITKLDKFKKIAN